VIRKYVRKLKKEKFAFSGVYLFGSYAKGKANEWSDIDIAVVSDEIERDWDENRKRLWRLTLGIDSRLEPHGFSEREFKENWHPMVNEIKKTGIKII